SLLLTPFFLLLLLGSKATLAGTLLSINAGEGNALMPRCCFALFATAKKTRLGYL
ncbi:unnamed protein product, partial [marine sediment metagenome]